MWAARWLRRTGWFVVCIALQSAAAQATCDHFPLLHRLSVAWEQSRTEMVLSVAQARDIHRSLADADFAMVSHRMRLADKEASTALAMAFFSDMSQLVSLALAEQPGRVSQMLQNEEVAARARQLASELEVLCDWQGTSATDRRISGGLTANDTSDDNSDRNALSVASQSDLQMQPDRPISNLSVGGGGTDDLDQFDIRELAFVLGFLVLICMTTVLVHVLLRSIRILRRYRKRCEVPAILSISVLDVPGTIFVTGKLGCGFQPGERLDEDTLSMMTMGAFCQIKVGERIIYAKLLEDAADTVGLRYSDPLALDDLRDVLRHSLSRPRFDLSAAAVTGTRKWAFGEGRMIRA